MKAERPQTFVIIRKIQTIVRQIVSSN